MKFAGILNEIGPTLNENAFHSFVVAKQIFLWQLPQLHHAIGSYQSPWPFAAVEPSSSASVTLPCIVSAEDRNASTSGLDPCH